MSNLKETITKLRGLVESKPLSWESLMDAHFGFTQALEDIVKLLRAPSETTGRVTDRHVMTALANHAEQALKKFGDLTEGEPEEHFDARLRLAKSLGQCVGALRNIADGLKFALTMRSPDESRKEVERLQAYAEKIATEFKSAVEGSVPLSGDHRVETKG